jgi:hypothetical protein
MQIGNDKRLWAMALQCYCSARGNPAAECCEVVT